MRKYLSDGNIGTCLAAYRKFTLVFTKQVDKVRKFLKFEVSKTQGMYKKSVFLN